MKETNNFLSEKECQDIIDKFKSLNGNYTTYAKRYLLNFDVWFKEIQFENIKKKFLKKNKKIHNMEVVFWPVGEFHIKHNDTKYYDFTTITYLNENYEGGRTIVEDVEIIPKTGKLLEFESNKLHMVTKLISGERFVLLCWYKNEYCNIE
jgi:hypothetical protein